MSDAIRCPNCNEAYWVGSRENWGTCTHCGTNNDFWKGEGKPELTTSDEVAKSLQKWRKSQMNDIKYEAYPTNQIVPLLNKNVVDGNGVEGIIHKIGSNDGVLQYTIASEDSKVTVNSKGLFEKYTLLDGTPIGLRVTSNDV